MLMTERWGKYGGNAPRERRKKPREMKCWTNETMTEGGKVSLATN